MNIVCTIDESYVQHCAVTLKSLYQHNSTAELNIFILNNGLSRKNYKKLYSFLSDFSQNVSFIEVNESLLNKCPISHHISLATYFRLFIPEVIPKKINKVLFLDSDIVIRKNITNFWMTDITNYSHAAVEAPCSQKDKERLTILDSYPYFNAGVLLINLEFWRQHDIFQKGLKYISDNIEKILWWDQDVLNYLLHPYWLSVDPIWNAQGGFWHEEFLNSPQATQKIYQVAMADPSIIHFSGGGSCKPWDYYCSHPFKEEYRKYRRQTPWKRTPLTNQPKLLDQVKAYMKIKAYSLLKRSKQS